MLSQKDLITINAQFHTGHIVNSGSLSYVLTETRRSKNWLRTAALVTRAVLIDHVFEDGNKRTAAAIIITLAEMHNVELNPDKVNETIIHILLKNTTDIRIIERFIKNAIQ